MQKLEFDSGYCEIKHKGDEEFIITLYPVDGKLSQLRQDLVGKLGGEDYRWISVGRQHYVVKLKWSDKNV